MSNKLKIVPIKYKDFKGTMKQKDYVFGYSIREIMAMEAGYEGKSFMKHFVDIFNSKDADAAIEAIEELVLNAYGELSGDGDVFMKSPEIKERFKHSAAYDALYKKILETPDFIQEFMKDVIPDMSKVKLPETGTLSTDDIIDMESLGKAEGTEEVAAE